MHALIARALGSSKQHDWDAFVVKEECRLGSACVGKIQRRSLKAIEESDDGWLSEEAEEQTLPGMWGWGWQGRHLARRSGAA